MYSSAEANAPKAAGVAAGGSLAVLYFIDVVIRVAPRVEAPLQRRVPLYRLLLLLAHTGPVESLPHDPISRLATPHSIVPGECAIRFWLGILSCRLETRW